MKPYSESCDQNRDVILEVIKPMLVDKQSVLEVGSGTGQHAVFFAEHMPHLIWHTSDRAENHSGIQMWLDEAALANTKPPISLDVSSDPWPEIEVDAVFSANAVHIMSWDNVVDFIQQTTKRINQHGFLILYGPFNYYGEYSSESNARFDQWLKQRDPLSGIRDFEALDKLVQVGGMELVKDYEMPVNNRILQWIKK